MRWIDALGARLRLLRRAAAEERMDEEMRFHLEMETDKNRRAGMSPEEARRRAVLAFGGLQGHREAMREGRTLAWLGGPSLDLRLGLRMLARYPGLTGIAGLALAFAIAFGAATFELVHLALGPSLPLPDGDRIVGLAFWDRESNEQALPVAHDLLAWREGLVTVRDVGGFRLVERNLFVDDGAGMPLEVAEIGAAAFRVVRVPPLLGRVLVEADERPGAPPVAVIGHRLWRSRFHGDPAVVGRTVRIGAERATVVGVMPEGFVFPIDHDVWTPLRLDAASARPEDGPPVRVFGRLDDGASLAEARSEVGTLAARAAADFPGRYRSLRAQVLPYAQSIIWISPDRLLRAGIHSINGFAALLLLLVCGNVALLMFARAASREREILVRGALGASRARIMAQLFAEALVLGGLAALLGLAAARFALERLEASLRLDPGEAWPFWLDAGLSGTTVLYAALLTLGAAAVAGVVPALKVTERGMESRLRQAAAGAGRLRMGGIWTALIITQIAATVVFTAVAWVVQRHAAAIASVQPAFPAERYLALRLDLEGPPHAAPGSTPDPARYAALVRGLEQRLAAHPSVVGVTVAGRLPLMPHPVVAPVEVEGGTAAEGGVPPVRPVDVAPDFFEVFGAPIVAGRGLRPGDEAPGAHAVVVNQRFVDGVLGGRNAVGRRIRYRPGAPAGDGGADAAPEPWYEIVGVVRDLVPDIRSPISLDSPTRPQVYHPLGRGLIGGGPLYLAAHVRGDPRALEAVARRAAGELSPALQLREVQTLDRATGGDARGWRLQARVVALASAIALTLSLAGIYSVMSFTVSRRTREIGVRVALGAPAPRVVLEIFRRPLAHVAAGVAVGCLLVGAVVAASRGTVTLGALALLLAYGLVMLGVCALACIAPTLRALRVEPTEALGSEG